LPSAITERSLFTGPLTITASLIRVHFAHAAEQIIGIGPFDLRPTGTFVLIAAITVTQWFGRPGRAISHAGLKTHGLSL
jgi:hypothetical protein